MKKLEKKNLEETSKAAGIRKTNYSVSEARKVTSEWNRIHQVISENLIHCLCHIFEED